MKIEDAIKHLEETLADPNHEWGCEQCKIEHEYLLEWLKQLKAIREAYESDYNIQDLIETCVEFWG